MNEEARKNLEYEEQFFGMSSRFFAISFKNFVKDEIELRVNTLVESFKAKLINQAANPEHFEKALGTMESELKKEYFNSLENSYKEIESKISDFMHIPQNVLLKEDLQVKKGFNRNISVLKEEVKNLEETYKSLLYLKQEIENELDEADLAIFLAESVLKEKTFDLNVLPVNEITNFSKKNNCFLKENFDKV